MRVNVLIVEDSRVSREAFERKITSFPEYSVIASIENAANAEIACMSNKIDLILMDVCTADDESGIRAAARVKKNYPWVRIILMTSMPEHSFIKKAQDSGCDSFWYKEYGNISLLEVCERTMKGEKVWPESSPVIMIGQAKSSEFTDREFAVIRELVRGVRYEEMAETLHLSINTVKYHVKNILQKTGFRSTIQLVAEVVEKRLVLPKY
jgi:DNA-binding NarL/FixJ family response regulator